MPRVPLNSSSDVLRSATRKAKKQAKQAGYRAKHYHRLNVALKKKGGK